MDYTILIWLVPLLLLLGGCVWISVKRGRLAASSRGGNTYNGSSDIPLFTYIDAGGDSGGHHDGGYSDCSSGDSGGSCD